MKKVMLALTMAAAMASTALATQCAGKTLTGERCKREAAEGSKFCIGHADQAKKWVLKDDGTCWAVTQDGARCKNKKVGETDYCALHAADKKPAEPVDQCRALTYDGQRCTRKPVAASFYCEQHRKLGKAPAAKAK